MNEIETRQFWGKKDYHEIFYGGNGKPISLCHHEPDKFEMAFLIKTDKHKVTVTPINKCK